MDNKKVAAIAIVLLVVAVLAIGRFVWTSRAGSATQPAMTASDVEKRISEIQNDPHMPPQAKSIAIGQLRAHMAGGPQGGAPASAGPASP